jgi:hypothetical protein
MGHFTDIQYVHEVPTHFSKMKTIDIENKYLVLTWEHLLAHFLAF